MLWKLCWHFNPVSKWSHDGLKWYATELHNGASSGSVNCKRDPSNPIYNYSLWLLSILHNFSQTHLHPYIVVTQTHPPPPPTHHTSCAAVSSATQRAHLTTSWSRSTCNSHTRQTTNETSPSSTLWPASSTSAPTSSRNTSALDSTSAERSLPPRTVYWATTFGGLLSFRAGRCCRAIQFCWSTWPGWSLDRLLRLQCRARSLSSRAVEVFRTGSCACVCVCNVLILYSAVVRYRWCYSCCIVGMYSHTLCNKWTEA